MQINLGMVFCYQNCSDLQWEKNVLMIVNVSTHWYFVTKLFWPTLRKNGFSDQEKLFKFEAEGQEFAKPLRSLEKFI